MLCPNCKNELRDGDIFCSKCGVNANEFNNLRGRVSTVEAQVRTVERLDQQRLEIDAAAGAMERVRSWITLMLYFAGIPVVAAGIFVAVVWGKGAWDIHTIAANASQQIQTLGDKTKKDAADAAQKIQETSDNAKKEAAETEKTVKAALNTTRQVEKDIKETNVEVGELRTDVKTRSDEVKALGVKVTSVTADLEATKQKATFLAQQVTETNREKEVIDIKNRYPTLYGERVVMSSFSGFIDRKQKGANETWVLLGVFQNIYQKPVFSAEALQAANAAIRTRAKLWEGTASLIVAGPNGGGQSLGINIDPGICMNGGLDTGLKDPPCILYFDEGSRTKAVEIRDLVKPTQFIGDDRIKFIPVDKMTKDYREIVERSGLDIVVVLGKLNPPN